MDPLERADILFAQLDVLLARGELDAARELARRLRGSVRDTGIGVSGEHPMSDEHRGGVLAPLSVLLREQRALHRDITAAAERAKELAEAKGPSPGVDPAQLGSRLAKTAEELQFGFESVAEQLEELAGDRILAEAGRGVARLRKTVRSGRIAPVREALEALHQLANDLPPEHLTSSRIESLLQEFLGLIDPTGLRSLTEGLAKRQGTLLASAAPAAPGDPGAAFDKLWGSLQEAMKGMGESRDHLLRREPARAEVPARSAARAVATALSAVDEALGARDFAALAGTGFLTPFVGGSQPEWELPAALGLRFHEELTRASVPAAARKELTCLVRELMDHGEADARVLFHRDSTERARGAHAIDVGVVGPEWRDDDARYVVRLEYERAAGGGIRPSRLPEKPQSESLGGRVEVLLAAHLEDASIRVFRLHNRGPGPRLGYLAEEEGLSMRELVELRTDQQFDVVDTTSSPVSGEVLEWIDQLENAAEPPIPEVLLRQLGIPWYDAADLVDRIRPLHEQLRIGLLNSKVPGEDFPGLAWMNESRQAYFAIDLGADGVSPRIMLPQALVKYLAWHAKRGDRQASEPTFNQISAAIQLHLGMKLTFYDDLEADRRGHVHKAAQALEGAYLQSKGIDPGAVRDIFTQLSMRYGADKEADRKGNTPWDKWARHAENLFESRAGEDMLRGGKIPAPAVMGPMRGLLGRSLYDQGQLAATRSIMEFDSVRDAAVLFANLVMEPTSGEGVLIIGDSKLGKSSITARLVTGAPRRGVAPWTFGSSDRVLVTIPRRGHGPDGTDRAMAMASPSHRSFGQWTEELWYRDADKREVKPKDYVVSQALVPIRSLVFVHRDGGEGRGRGLRPLTIADLVADFQHRFGFGASRRFWRDLFGSVSLMDLSLRRRGADTFHESADAIRAHMHVAHEQVGLGRPCMITVEEQDAWYGVGAARGRIRLTRVGSDGLDLDYLFAPDGSVHGLPSHLGKEVPLAPPRTYALEGLETLIPLDSGKVEQLYGQPHYKASAGKLMPLPPHYFRSTMSGPAFLVPDLALRAATAVREVMTHKGAERWGGYLESFR